jgi:hypothetical protein
VLEGTFPISYRVEQTPARVVLQDLLFTANADYYEEIDGIYVSTTEDINAPQDIASVHAIQNAKREYELKLSEPTGLEKQFQIELSGKPMEVLSKLMVEYGILPTKNALAVIAAATDDIIIAGTLPLSEIVAELARECQMAQVPAFPYPRILATDEEQQKAAQTHIDLYQIKEDLYQRTIDGEIKDTQLYKIAKNLEDKTGVTVLVDRNAWQYADFITLAGKDHTVKTVFDTLDHLGFASIILMDENTRRERLFIFEKPEEE